MHISTRARASVAVRLEWASPRTKPCSVRRVGAALLKGMQYRISLYYLNILTKLRTKYGKLQVQVDEVLCEGAKAISIDKLRQNLAYGFDLFDFLFFQAAFIPDPFLPAKALQVRIYCIYRIFCMFAHASSAHLLQCSILQVRLYCIYASPAPPAELSSSLPWCLRRRQQRRGLVAPEPGVQRKSQQKADRSHYETMGTPSHEWGPHGEGGSFTVRGG